jgi:hypothetical protein
MLSLTKSNSLGAKSLGFMIDSSFENHFIFAFKKLVTLLINLAKAFEWGATMLVLR